MYAQMGNRRSGDQDSQGVEVYTSKDLKNWTGPMPVLSLQDDFQAVKSVWAPEVHFYKNAYYLFVTFTSEEKISEVPHPKTGKVQWKRGTHIFKSNSPLGPFKALQQQAQTPAHWMSLDGTLWVDNTEPYMVFCHEWAQIFDGSLEVVKLSDDLSKAVGEPEHLFKASEAGWVRNMKDIGYEQNGLVTDGPFVYKNRKGALIMIWSSFGEQEYAIGQAISISGSIFGPWQQINEPIVKANGGHGMLFHRLDHQLMLAHHQPNSRGKERLHLKEIRENDEGLLEIADSSSHLSGARKAPEGWQMLFNGQNFEGWYMVARDSNFRGDIEKIFAIKNGIIHTYPNQEAFSEQTFAGLITKKTYSHYRLSLEYRWGEKKFKPRHEFVRDAGVLFHVHGKDDIWPNSVECQIQEGDTGDLWAIGTRVSSKVQKVIRNYSTNGAIVTLGNPNQRFHRFHRSYSWEEPDWNRLDLEVRGDQAIFKVNGKVVNEAIDMQYYDEKTKSYHPLKKGKILIQAEGAEIYYRNIFIQTLPDNQ